jgi:virulence-associated protein VagC
MRYIVKTINYGRFVMKKNSIIVILSIIGLMLPFVSHADANDIPPQGSKLLSAIIKTMEGQYHGSIFEAEFEDGLWEVKICDTGVCQKLYLDPQTGKEVRQKKTDCDEIPPAGSMPISKIIQSVEAQGLGIITEFEFDDGFWEVKLRKDGRKVKLIIDPMTGESSVLSMKKRTLSDDQMQRATSHPVAEPGR